MEMEKYLQKIVQISLSSTPEDMLKTSLEICIEIAEGSSGSILGEEGPYLQFLFSEVPALIGVRVPFDSIAGSAMTKNLVIYTHAPSDKRHFDGIDKQLKKTTNYLLSIPIPSIHSASSSDGKAKNAGTLQILFDRDVFPDLGVEKGPREFSLGDFKRSGLNSERINNIFIILPLIAFGIEVMRLRQTSYQVIHELKNKMISAGSWIGCLKEDIASKSPELAEDEAIKEDFTISENAIREGAEMAKSYLQLTKLYTPNFKMADINAVLKETASSAKALSSELGIADFAVETALDAGIGRKELDEEKLKMAFFNLCKNALEVLRERSVDNPRIKISSSLKEDGCMEIRIGDNGPGMPPEIADNLFIPFKTKKEGGTGLGLTITKKIIDLHAGSISCHTGSGGTEFRMTL
ncbi:MAG TPA: hypothetical protein DET40_13755 [Lentisphaeria bacterium]|nr:MAG: hypothetical protein A2X45_01765 [Lentisphaerae bacterium GWF2_50_93]HCE44606.1 hypothetical protein [Lentisphaeria bacterium]